MTFEKSVCALLKLPNVRASSAPTIYFSGESRSSPSLHLFMRSMGIAPYFSYVIGSDSVEHHNVPRACA